MKLTITLEYYGITTSASIDNDKQHYRQDRTVAESLFKTMMDAADVTDQEEETEEANQ